MRRTAIAAVLCMLLGCCWGSPALAQEEEYPEAVAVVLDGEQVTVDGEAAPADNPASAVYIAHDIVYYEEGHDFTYGEGTEADEHTAEEAAAHTVVHITKPGTYLLSGTLEQGQIAVDLGEEAREDPQAVVTLVLEDVSVTCTVAPAVIFYNVYECDPEGDQGEEPDLSGAGARVILADGSVNNITGSYVARIYESYTLSEDGTEVVDSKKLHKYDGAFYSRQSMVVSGETEGSGVLHITAENEGLDTEMHLALNGGNVSIRSGNDGINVNEDAVSVAEVNGGTLDIVVTGETGEGDGIDSNGWLVIRGGSVTAQACSASADSGIDGENGIIIQGGTVTATGNMLDPLTLEGTNGVVFTFRQRQSGGTTYTVSETDGGEVLRVAPDNGFTCLLLVSPDWKEDTFYSFLSDGDVLSVAEGGGMGGPGGPDRFGGIGGQPPEGLPEGGAREDRVPPEEGERSEKPEEGKQPELPEGEVPKFSEGEQPPEIPDGGRDGQPEAGQADADSEAAETFSVQEGLNTFIVSP